LAYAIKFGIKKTNWIWLWGKATGGFVMG
jgi:hypothetical protein